VPVSWLRQQVRCANQGWDAVAGTVRVTDWAARHPDVRSLFRQRYGSGPGPHPHVHGTNLGFRASAYLTAGGFPDEPTAEDHALVTALTATGSRILRTGAVRVVTSARRSTRTLHGFSHYLAELEGEADAASA